MKERRKSRIMLIMFLFTKLSPIVLQIKIEILNNCAIRTWLEVIRKGHPRKAFPPSLLRSVQRSVLIIVTAPSPKDWKSCMNDRLQHLLLKIQIPATCPIKTQISKTNLFKFIVSVSLRELLENWYTKKVLYIFLYSN